MKTIALIDTFWFGHHPTYLKIFSKILLELDCRVITFCPEPADLKQWIAQSCPKQIELFHAFELQEPEINQVLIGLAPQTFTALAHWQHSASAIQKASAKIGSSPDLVFFAWLDSYLSTYLTHRLVDKIFPYKWSGLYFRSYYTHLKQQGFSIRRNFLSPHTVLKSSYCQAVAILNENTAENLQSKLKNKPVIIFPDFTDESPADLSFPITKQIEEKAAGRKIVGLLGSLDRRKGFLTLLEVSQQIAEDYFFVFAGKFGESSFLPQELMRIQTIVKSAPHNCFFYFERIPNEAQFNSLVNVCDILFAVYNKFPHSSNILTKAATFKKPVIVSNKFCMAERVRKFGLGLTINEGNTLQCIEALYKLFSQSESDTRQTKQDFEGYKQFHSTERLYTAFSAILKTL